MGKKHFSLEIRDDNNLIKVFRIVFGLLCSAIAIFWMIFNFRSAKEDRTLWVTVVFLISFGIFQVYSGFGYASKFIELTDKNIRLKRNSLLPAFEIQADQIEKIEVFPLKLLIILKPAKTLLLRLGITNPERIELIKDEIINFASINFINLEIKNEEIL